MNRFDKLLLEVAPSYVRKRLESKANALRVDQQIRRYEGATKGVRGKSFETRSTTANKENRKYAKTLRDRSRDLSQNTPHNERAIKVIANNVVGTGIFPTPVSQSNSRLVDGLKASWKNWAESVSCDYDGNENFYGLQKLAVKIMRRDGECLALRRIVMPTVNLIGLQIQILEIEYLDTLKNVEKTAGGGWVQNGIEYNSNGQRISYWLFERHPEDAFTQSKPVAYADLCHIYETERAGQHSGVPASSSTMLIERDIADYQDAEIYGKKISSALVGIFTNTSPGAGEADDDDYDDFDAIKMTPGSFYRAKPGESVTFNSPPQNPNYEGFMRTNMRSIATGNDLTYEALTNDYSQVNFSSGRMGFLEFQRIVEDLQWMTLIPKFCEKAYQWLLQKAKVQNSFVELPKDFYVTWTTPKREMIDPSKEVAATLLELQMGTVSWDEVVMMKGYIPEEVFAKLKEWHEKFKQEGIPASWLTPPAGTPVSADSNKEEQ